MHFLLLLVVVSVVPASSTKGKLDNQGLLELITWQEAAQEVNRTNTLAQVLQEYLHDIELVEEAAASKCSAHHRDRYSRAQKSLKEEMDFCVKSMNKTRETESLVKCVEERTKTVISDVRNHISQLKSCLDSS